MERKYYFAICARVVLPIYPEYRWEKLRAIFIDCINFVYCNIFNL